MACSDEPTSVCAGLGEYCFRDEACADETADPFDGLGCNAGGVGLLCRFCGFENYPMCPPPTAAVVINVSIPLSTECPSVCGPDPDADRCFHDPTCSTGDVTGISGCNAGGFGQDCRFCGGPGEPECPCSFAETQIAANGVSQALGSGAGSVDPGSSQTKLTVTKEVNVVLSAALFRFVTNITFAHFDILMDYVGEAFCYDDPGCTGTVSWNSLPTNDWRRTAPEYTWDQTEVKVTISRKFSSCDDSADRQMDALLTNSTALVLHLISHIETVYPGSMASLAEVLGLVPGSVSFSRMALLSLTTLSSAYAGVRDPADRADNDCARFNAAAEASAQHLGALSAAGSGLGAITVDVAYMGSAPRQGSYNLAPGETVPCDLAAATLAPPPPPTPLSPPPPPPPSVAPAPPPAVQAQTAPTPTPPLEGGTEAIEAAAAASGGGALLAGVAVVPLLVVALLYCRRRSRLRRSGIEMARDKPVAASSYEDGSTRPANAVDGSRVTWWSSGPVGDNTHQWIAVDMLQAVDLQDVSITWQGGNAQQYLVQGSMDALAWRTLRQVTPVADAEVVQIITDVSGKQARFIRVLCLRLPANGTGYGIRSLEVRGEPAAIDLSVSGSATPDSAISNASLSGDPMFSGIIPWEDVTLTELLGSSRSDFGHVYRASYRNSSGAMRRLGPQMLAIQGVEEVREEVRKLTSLSNPRLMQIHGFVTDGSHNHGILMEYVGRSMHDLLNSPFAASLDWESAWLGIAAGVADGMAYLHSNGVMHGSLRPQNIMLDDNLGVKLADFGRNKKVLSAVRLALNQDADEDEESGEPTQAYCAPEMLHGDDQSQKTDSWSYGCLLARMGSGMPLYSSLGDVSWYITMLRVCSGQATPLSELRFSSNCPREIFLLASHCLSLEPEKRLQFNRIKLLLTRVNVNGTAAGGEGGGGAAGSGPEREQSGRRKGVASKEKDAQRRGSLHVVPSTLPAPHQAPESGLGAGWQQAGPSSGGQGGMSRIDDSDVGAPGGRLDAPKPRTSTKPRKSKASGEGVDSKAKTREDRVNALERASGVDLDGDGDVGEDQPKKKKSLKQKPAAGTSGVGRSEVVLGESTIHSAKQVRAGRVRI